MVYFSEFSQDEKDLDDIKLLKKSSGIPQIKREAIPGFANSRGYFFSVGEFLKILLYYRNIPFVFEGVCLSIRCKNFKNINTSIFLRNIVVGVGIEIVFSFFFSRSYSFQILEYKRRIKNYRRAKIMWYKIKISRDHTRILS